MPKSNSNGKPSAWIKTTREIELPSGNVVEMRPVGFDLLLRSGRVPDFLTPLIIRAFKGKGELDMEELSDVLGFFDLMDLCVDLAFVHPTAAEIGLENIAYVDKVVAFQSMGQSPRWLDNFRPESARDGATGSDESGVSRATESTSELA